MCPQFAGTLFFPFEILFLVPVLTMQCAVPAMLSFVKMNLIPTMKVHLLAVNIYFLSCSVSFSCTVSFFVVVFFIFCFMLLEIQLFFFSIVRCVLALCVLFLFEILFLVPVLTMQCAVPAMLSFVKMNLIPSRLGMAG